MNYDFIITLKRPGYRYINLVSILLLFIFLLAFAYYMLQVGWAAGNYWLLLIPGFIIGLAVYGFIRRNEKDFLVYYRTELFIAALGWFLLPSFAEVRFLGWLYAGMAIIERYVKFPDEWAFSKEQVVHNSFPKKSYEWVEIDNVVLRENLFTIDFRNNKIIQKELDSPVDKDTETEFNAYCAQQLHFTSQVG
jgi:hypothetical protein